MAKAALIICSAFLNIFCFAQTEYLGKADSLILKNRVESVIWKYRDSENKSYGSTDTKYNSEGQIITKSGADCKDGCITQRLVYSYLQGVVVNATIYYSSPKNPPGYVETRTYQYNPAHDSVKIVLNREYESDTTDPEGSKTFYVPTTVHLIFAFDSLKRCSTETTYKEGTLSTQVTTYDSLGRIVQISGTVHANRFSIDNKWTIKYDYANSKYTLEASYKNERKSTEHFKECELDSNGKPTKCTYNDGGKGLSIYYSNGLQKSREVRKKGKVTYREDFEYSYF